MRCTHLLAVVAASTIAGSSFAQLTDEQISQLYMKPSPFEKVARERVIAESENAFAVRDINPQAPVHLLVISKTRYPTLLQAPDALVAEMMGLA